MGKSLKTIAEIRRQLGRGEFEYSRHAIKRAIERDITDLEIRHAGIQAELIEDYPEDKYSPSCLVLGFTEHGRPLHLQVSYAQTELVKIITLYEPDPREWTHYRTRKSP